MSTLDPELQKTFDYIVERTEATQKTSSGDLMGICPAHADEKASLSIKLTDDRIMLNCFAGCGFDNIIKSIELAAKDLFAPGYRQTQVKDKKATTGHLSTPKTRSEPNRKEVERYYYKSNDGTPAFVVIRQEAVDAEGKKHKNFPQTKVDPSGNTPGTWTMEGVQRLPYHLPELREAIQANRPIILVEGEKDVHSAEKLGFSATTIPGGAKSNGGEKVVDECAEWFEGADLLLCPDNDESGKPWMRMIGKQLQAKAKRIRWLELPGMEHKEDLSDWVNKGGNSAKFQGLISNATDFIADPSPESPKPKSDFYLEPWSSLKISKPNWLVKGVLECHTLAAVIGESGSGKSFIVVDIACCIATGTPWHGRNIQQGTVVYLVGEGRSGLERRISAWEHHQGIKPERLLLSSKAIDLGDRGRELPKVQAALRELPEPPVLIIIDTLARHSTGAEASNEEMSAFISNLDALKDEFKTTVVVVHHVGKDPTKGARGPSAFRAALDHELLTVKPDTGVINLTCEKSKDAEPFMPMGFKLQAADVFDEQGRPLADDDGSAIKSCILQECEPTQPTKEQTLTGKQQQARDIFFELRKKSKNGVVTRADWYKRLEVDGITPHDKTKKALKDKMVEIGLFLVRDEGTKDEYFVTLNQPNFEVSKS